MKPKEWLLANGHIKEIGRGRMSKDHIVLITEAAKDTFIEGYSSGTLAKPKVAVAKPVLNNGQEIVELAPILYPHEAYTAVYYLDGKRKTVTTKSACQQHGYSICGHECPGAIVSTVDGSVTISHIEGI